MLKITMSDELIERAVREYSDTLLKIAYQHTRDIHVSEDIVQEVFVRFVKKTSFNSNEHIKAWLIRVTVNKCHDYAKSINNHNVPFDDAIKYSVNADENVSLFDEISKLPPIQKDIIYLFYYERYTAKEIGKILGKSENAVYIRLNKARKELKNIILDGDEK